RRREGGDDEGRDRAGKERAEGRDREGGAGLALARHLMAVDAGDDRGGLARQVDQDGGGRAAILRAIEDAGEHDQAGYRLEMKGERQQHRDGGDRSDARQHADQGADQRPNQREAEIGGCERDAEAEREIVEKLHHHTGQTGIVKPSPRMKIAQHSATSTSAATATSHSLMSRAATAPMPTRRSTESTKPSCSIASEKAMRLA